MTAVFVSLSDGGNIVSARPGQCLKTTWPRSVVQTRPAVLSIHHGLTVTATVCLSNRRRLVGPRACRPARFIVCVGTICMSIPCRRCRDSVTNSCRACEYGFIRDLSSMGVCLAKDITSLLDGYF